MRAQAQQLEADANLRAREVLDRARAKAERIIETVTAHSQAVLRDAEDRTRQLRWQQHQLMSFMAEVKELIRPDMPIGDADIAEFGDLGQPDDGSSEAEPTVGEAAAEEHAEAPQDESPVDGEPEGDAPQDDATEEQSADDPAAEEQDPEGEVAEGSEEQSEVEVAEVAQLVHPEDEPADGEQPDDHHEAGEADEGDRDETAA
jgi:hypothetical protein